MKVSVSIVTYNHENFIGLCLDSILSQQVNFDFEIVVGEDFSTDATRKVLLKYYSRYPKIIKPLLHKSNLGVHNNFQTVLDNCTGEYIAHLDGDDLMLPGKLQKQVDFLDTHPDFVMVSHDMRIFDSDSNKTLGFFNSDFKLLVGEIGDLIRYGTYFGNSSKMYRRSSLPEEGIDKSTAYVIDWLFHIQSARHGKIGYIDEVLGEYRKHIGGTTHFDINKSLLVLKDQEYTLNVAGDLIKDQAVIDTAYSRIYYTFAWECFLREHFAEFTHYMSKSGEKGIFIDSAHSKLHAFRQFPRLLFAARKIKNIFTASNV